MVVDVSEESAAAIFRVDGRCRQCVFLEVDTIYQTARYDSRLLEKTVVSLDGDQFDAVWSFRNIN